MTKIKTGDVISERGCPFCGCRHWLLWNIEGYSEESITVDLGLSIIDGVDDMDVVEECFHCGAFALGPK